MRFACQACQAKYAIADERVLNKVVRLKCQKCGADITVRGPTNAPSAQAQSPTLQPTPAGPTTLSSVEPIARGQTGQIAPIVPAEPARHAEDALGSAFDTPEEEDSGERATKIASLNELENIRKAAAADAATKAAAPAKPVQETPRPKPAPVPEPRKPEWFVLMRGAQEGPLNETKIKQRIVDGDIGPRTYAWREGLAEWQRLQHVPEFSACFISSADGSPDAAPSAAIAAKKEPPPLAATPKAKAEPTPEALSSLLDASIAPDDGKLQGSPWTGPHRVKTDETVAPGSSSESADLKDLFAPTQAEPESDFSAVGSAFTDSAAQPPRENTRMFIAAAGLVQRKRRQRQIIMAVSVLAVALITVIGLDIAGVIHIPALGAAYELVGVDNPHVDMGEAQFQSNLTEEERERLKQHLLGNKAKEGGPKHVASPGAGKGGAQKTETGAAGDPFADKADAAGTNGGDQKMLADVFDDTSKTETKVEQPKAKLPEQDLPQGLNAEAIGKVVESNQKAVKFCFERALKRGQQLSGRMEVEFTIMPIGTVSEVTVKTAKLKGTEFGDCVSNSVKGWKFPRFAGDPVTVEYPFILSAGF